MIRAAALLMMIAVCAADMALASVQGQPAGSRAYTSQQAATTAGEETPMAGSPMETSGSGNAARADRVELEASDLARFPSGFRPQIEGLPIPSALRALMEFVGEDFGYYTSSGGDEPWRSNRAFELFMAVWGDSFEFVWLPKEGADRTAVPVLENGAERFAAVLDAAGFDGDAVLREEGAAPFEEEALRDRVVASIADRGWPVIVLDLPTPHHVALVTGYDEGGKKLLGWSVEGGDDRGIRFEPEKRREFSDWATRTSGVVLLTRKRARADARAVYRRALQQGLGFLREREAGDFHAGAATFEAWAKRIDDPGLSADDAETAKRRRGILDPMMWDLATRRHYGRLFLHTAAELFPEAADELHAAAECFAAEHDMMWEVNRLGGARWAGDDLPNLGDPAVRKRIGEIIPKCRDKDLEAARQIEAALSKWPR